MSTFEKINVIESHGIELSDIELLRKMHPHLFEEKNIKKIMVEEEPNAKSKSKNVKKKTSKNTSKAYTTAMESVQA